MSSKSRGRHRFAHTGGPDPVDPDEAARAEAAVDAFEHSNTRAGLRKLVGLILDDRERQEAAKNPDAQYETADGDQFDLGGTAEARGLRTPTQYELAILSGLSRRPVYGGTVEPWRIADRRRRNKAARQARRGRPAPVGGSSKSARLARRKSHA